MNRTSQIALALALDGAFGDPRDLPHPVRWIGAFAASLEAPMRKLLPPRIAGIATSFTVLTTVGATTWGVLRVARTIHPSAGRFAGVVVLWTTLAARDLASHAMRVHDALERGDLVEARARLSWMVGRDTAHLSEPEIVRATVETVAENTVDGVTAPLFYAVFFGPVGAMVYKAINTMDSMFGYKNERYLHFGFASARIDDLANLVPSRLTALAMAVAASLTGLDGRRAFSTWFSDGAKHPSPNSAQCEAAMAGALGVQLGGPATYAGKPSMKPTLGHPHVALERAHIKQAVKLMQATTIVATASFWAIRTLMPTHRR
jgi:adenosylcobinamide-phosphate synthase